MRYLLLPCLLLAALINAHADSCSFPLQNAAPISCGADRASLLERFGEPLFMGKSPRNERLLPSTSEGSQTIENWVYRLTNQAGTPNMVSIRLIDGKVSDIISSR